MQRRTLLKLLSSTVLGVSLFASQLAHADSLEHIGKAGVIKIAIPQDFPPFGSLNKDLKLEGYDIDIANLVATELKVKVELVPVTSTNRIPYLTTGKVDLVISSLGKNAERAKVIDFTDAYAPFVKSIFGPDDIAVSSAADLAGKTIGVTRGSTEDLALTQIAPPTATIRRFEDNNSTVTSYLSNQVQLVALGNIVANSVSTMSHQRAFKAKFAVESTPCYIGVPKGEAALLAKVNGIIAAAKADGRLNKLSERWMKEPLPKGF